MSSNSLSERMLGLSERQVFIGGTCQSYILAHGSTIDDPYVLCPLPKELMRRDCRSTCAASEGPFSLLTRGKRFNSDFGIILSSNRDTRPVVVF